MSSHREKDKIQNIIRAADATVLAALRNPQERERFFLTRGLDLNHLSAEERQEIEAVIAQLSGPSSPPTV